MRWFKREYLAIKRPKAYSFRKKRFILWLAPLSILAVLGIAWIQGGLIDWQLRADEETAKSFVPSNEIAKITSELKLTRKGRAVFYASHP